MNEVLQSPRSPDAPSKDPPINEDHPRESPFFGEETSFITRFWGPFCRLSWGGDLVSGRHNWRMIIPVRSDLMLKSMGFPENNAAFWLVSYVPGSINSHYFHIIGDGKNQPNGRGL